MPKPTIVKIAGEFAVRDGLSLTEVAQAIEAAKTVLDPFAGLMTVPYCALKLRRRAIGIELSADYFRDGVRYVEAAAREASVPTLFDAIVAVEETLQPSASPPTWRCR